MTSNDVLIVGAGPAGATAAIVLARAGVRVTLLDRARFPRPKLCGDTLNPGTLAALSRLGLDAAACGALPLAGMRVTGPGGAGIDGRYPPGVSGASLSRREFDQRLVALAVAAGVDLREQVSARAAVLAPTPRGRPQVAGVVTAGVSGHPSELRATVVIAADGRASKLASALGLSVTPRWPRRWAAGAYFEGVEGLGPVGEMHVRRGYYLGIAPLPGGLANAILVMSLDDARSAQAPVAGLLQRALAGDRLLAPRFSRARAVGSPTILGPMAVDVRALPPPGLLLAGDAAGFIDPMTGDGMRFAIAGGELAARAALDALEHGWDGVQERLARARHEAFARKWRFNRALRRVAGSPSGVTAVAHCAALLAPVLRKVINYAGDVR